MTSYIIVILKPVIFLKILAKIGALNFISEEGNQMNLIQFSVCVCVALFFFFVFFSIAPLR